MNKDSEYKADPASDLDFTYWAHESFFSAVDDPYFRDSDLDVIYSTLIDKVRVVSFGDYLKRYIYQKAELSQNFSEIPLTTYIEIIRDEFQDRGTPPSFTPTTARIRNLAKNWLEQQTVSRNVVLLLGFGLGMSAEDVNEFLVKALKEPKLNAKDPFEVVCWYCYKNGYNFYKYEALWDTYLAHSEDGFIESINLDSTMNLSEQMLRISNDEDLMAYLSFLPLKKGSKRQSEAARAAFDRLYTRSLQIVSDIRRETETDMLKKKAARLQEALNRNDRLYDFEKAKRMLGHLAAIQALPEEDVGASEIEHVLFAAVPKDSNGNLVPMKASSLNHLFSGKRLNRQHIAEILSGKAPITRYDLITLNFFVFSQDFDPDISSIKRYSAFIDETNKILSDSQMGQLYVVNPYESFLLMCMLSDDPLGTFADVWELSYKNT